MKLLWHGPSWPILCLAQADVENSEAKWIGCQYDFILLGHSVCHTSFTGAWEGAHADFDSNSILYKAWPSICFLYIILQHFYALEELADFGISDP